MKRFRFRLQRVLKLKQQRERLAELRQLQARRALEAIRAEAARLRERLGQTAGALGGKLGAPIPAAAWVAYYEHSAQLGQAIEAAEARAERAARTLQEAAAQHAEIAREVESLLSLRRSQWELYLQDAARVEQTRLDELGMRGWTSAQLGGGPEAPAREGELP